MMGTGHALKGVRGLVQSSHRKKCVFKKHSDETPLSLLLGKLYTNIYLYILDIYIVANESHVLSFPRYDWL